MTRRDFTELDLHMALDSELPGEDSAAFEAWLEANPDMQAKNTRYVADQAALRGALASVLDEPVPARLHRLVTGEASQEAARSRSRWWLAAAASVALLIIGGAGGYIAAISGLTHDEASDDQLAEEAIAAHIIYAAEKRHAVEVPASDKDHLQKWLSNRVGLKLVTPDLTADGFQLVGGRLLPAGTNNAAMLLYEDESGNRISVFITAESSRKTAGVYNQAAGGPSAVYWLDKGYGCAVVGTLPADRLNEVAKRAYQQLASTLWS